MPGPALALLAGVTHSSRLAYALLLTALTACGGKSFDTDPNPDNGGTDQGGSGHAGTGSAGKGQGGSGVAGNSYGGMSSAGTGTGGAGSICDTFSDARGTYISVEIINKTSAAIYLGQQEVNCSVSPLFAVNDVAGALLAPPNGCQGTCQTLRDNGPIGCPAICAFPSSTAIQPGQVMYTTWSGLYQLQRELPRQCIQDDYGNVCQQTVQVQPGQFTFSAIAGRSIDCTQSSGGPCQACLPNENGCVTQGALISGEILKAATTVTLGPAYGVYGTAAPAPAAPGSGIPNPNPGGGSSGAIALQAVQIVFTE